MRGGRPLVEEKIITDVLAIVLTRGPGAKNLLEMGLEVFRVVIPGASEASRVVLPRAILGVPVRNNSEIYGDSKKDACRSLFSNTCSGNYSGR